MALRVEYLVRETGNNLRRNVALTIPAVLTVAVSLALFGVSLLLGGGADRFTQQWRGGIEFIIFMNPDASQDQVDLIQNAVSTSPEVKRWKYFDQQMAFDEFRELFKDKPDLVNSVTPEILPPSYRVVPQNPDADAVTALAAQFENQPGVKDVRVSLKRSLARIEIGEGRALDLDELKQTIIDAGFTPGDVREGP